MNIALISMNASPFGRLGVRDGSGQSVLVDGLSRALAELGHRVRIYVRRDDPSLPPMLQAAPNVWVVHLDAGPALPLPAADAADAVDAFAAKLADALVVDPPDLAHAVGTMSGKAAAAAVTGAAIPLVATFSPLVLAARRHDGSLDEQCALVRAAARVIATSSAHVFALMSLGANPAKIKFVPCGVDLDLFRPEARLAPEGAGRPVRIATLGSLGVREGIADVIAALPYLPGVRLIVGGGQPAGDGMNGDADATRLFALAQSLGVADRVDFRGHIARDDVPAFLRAADIVVCAPHVDSLGTVALEAMACGLPVIATSVGGLVDAVADGMTGVHIPPRSPRQCAYAIEALRSDALKRERFGRFGVERANARYGWARIATDTLDVYRSVVLPAAQLSQSRA